MKNFLPFIILIMASGCATSVPLERKESENNQTYKVEEVRNRIRKPGN